MAVMWNSLHCLGDHEDSKSELLWRKCVAPNKVIRFSVLTESFSSPQDAFMIIFFYCGNLHDKLDAYINFFCPVGLELRQSTRC